MMSRNLEVFHGSEFSRVLHVTAEANGRKRHRLGCRDVVYFRLKGSLEAEGMQLNRADRRNVYAVLSAKTHSAGSWERKGLKLTRTGDVPVSLDLTTIVRSTQSALRIAKRGASLVERHAEVCSGAPVFIETRLPLAQVVEQFRAGVSFSEIAEDYPRLTAEALRYAQLCARLGQAPGRSSKAVTLRRTAIEAAD